MLHARVERLTSLVACAQVYFHAACICRIRYEFYVSQQDFQENESHEHHHQPKGDNQPLLRATSEIGIGGSPAKASTSL